MNRVILIGRLVRDPEVRTVASGHAMARFALAVDRGVVNVHGEREVHFIDVVAWRTLAEQVAVTRLCGPERRPKVSRRLKSDRRGLRPGRPASSRVPDHYLPGAEIHPDEVPGLDLGGGFGPGAVDRHPARIAEAVGSRRRRVPRPVPLRAPHRCPARRSLSAREFLYEPKQVVAKAGEITFIVKNAGSIEHDFVVEDARQKIRAQVTAFAPRTAIRFKAKVNAASTQSPATPRDTGQPECQRR